MVVKVRGSPVDATELRNVESIEDLIAANGSSARSSVSTVPGSLDSSTTSVPLGKWTVNSSVRRSKLGPWMTLDPKPFGGGFDTTTLSDAGFVEPSKGGETRFSRFFTCAGPP
jgi:hypothetical protein